MKIEWLEGNDPRPTEEPLIALVSVGGSIAYASLLDDGFEHVVSCAR